jgi:DNA-binding MarR family transcriptional regulator
LRHLRPSPIRCIVSTEWFGRTVPSASAEGTILIDTSERDAAIEAVIAGYEALMHSLAETHAPEFLEIAVTMPQAKLLYLLGASGDLHMSDLVVRLGVSLSTVSGLVDRIVDQGLASRREDPADRRQVVVGLTERGTAFINHFRDLNAVQMRSLLGLIDDDELASVNHALAALARAAEQVSVASRTTPRKDPA